MKLDSLRLSCVAAGVACLTIGVCAGERSALEPASGASGASALDAGTLALLVGAGTYGSAGPGDTGPQPRDCVTSPANCTVLGCAGRPIGSECTSCTPGPGSMICQNSTVQSCSGTNSTNCPDALQGTCTTGGCFTHAQSPVAECGVYYNCF